MTRVEYRPDVDGLRAVAVTLVLGFHAFPGAISGGFIGVDVFFVISGFLITKIILTKDFSFVEFYARRARRLFPALIVVVATSLAAGWLYFTPAQFQALGRQAFATALFGPNLLFWSEAGYFDASAHTKPLLHLWSLGVEEQFYLAWPALLLAARRLRLRLVWVLLSVTAASLLCSYLLQRTGATAANFYSPFSRAWELSAGGLLALVPSTRIRSSLASVGIIAGVGVVIASARVVDGNDGWPGTMAILIVLGTMLTIYCGAASQIAQRTLGTAPMAFLGRVSYPLYLWHWPILTFLYLRNGADLSTTQATLALLASLGLAIATYTIVERPLASRLNDMRQLRRAATATASVLALIGAAGVVVSLLDGIPSRLPAALRETLAYETYDFKSDAYNPGCWLGNAEPTSQMLPVCIQAGRSDSVAIWGDSHAARLSPGLRSVYGADRVSQFTRNSCAPVLGLGAPAASGCRDGNDAVLELIRNNNPRTVILFGAWQNYPADWDSASNYGRMLADTIRSLKALGVAEVLVVGPAPRFDPSLPAMLLRDWSLNHWTTTPLRLKADRSATRAIDVNIRQIAAAEGARFLSLLDLLCDADGCLTRLENSAGRLLTWDYGHLTTDGAILVARTLDNRRSGGRTSTND